MIRCRYGRAIDRCAESGGKKIIQYEKHRFLHHVVRRDMLVVRRILCRTSAIGPQLIHSPARAIRSFTMNDIKINTQHIIFLGFLLAFFSLVRREEGSHAFLLFERWKRNRFIVGFGMCAQ